MLVRFCRLFALLLLMSPLSAQAAGLAEVPYALKNADPVVFSHDLHLRNIGNNCKACHNTVYDLRTRTRSSMAEMEKNKSCGACHNGTKTFSVAASSGCVRCHKGKVRDVTFRVKAAGDVPFGHATHATRKTATCGDCHNARTGVARKRGVSMAEMEKGVSCGLCHNSSKAFGVTANCDRCHKGFKPGKVVFKTSSGDAPFSHDFHTQAYQCADCHIRLFPYKKGKAPHSMADMEQGKSCGACHNKGKDAFTVSENCDKCHAM